VFEKSVVVMSILCEEPREKFCLQV